MTMTDVVVERFEDFDNLGFLKRLTTDFFLRKSVFYGATIRSPSRSPSVLSIPAAVAFKSAWIFRKQNFSI